MKELFVMIVLAASDCSIQLCWCSGQGQSNKAVKKVAKGWEGLCLCGMGCWSAQDVLVSSSEAVDLEQGLLQTFSSRQIDSVCSCWLCSCLLCVSERENLPSANARLTHNFPGAQSVSQISRSFLEMTGAN